MILAVSTIAAIVMALAVFAIRMKASKKPATLKKIILPPFFMSTGALMYVFEPFRLSGTENSGSGFAWDVFLDFPHYDLPF